MSNQWPGGTRVMRRASNSDQLITWGNADGLPAPNSSTKAAESLPGPIPLRTPRKRAGSSSTHRASFRQSKNGIVSAGCIALIAWIAQPARARSERYLSPPPATSAEGERQKVPPGCSRNKTLPLPKSSEAGGFWSNKSTQCSRPGQPRASFRTPPVTFSDREACAGKVAEGRDTADSPRSSIDSDRSGDVLTRIKTRSLPSSDSRNRQNTADSGGLTRVNRAPSKKHG